METWSKDKDEVRKGKTIPTSVATAHRAEPGPPVHCTRAVSAFPLSNLIVETIRHDRAELET